MTVGYDDDLLVNFSSAEQAMLIRANKSCHVNVNSVIKKMEAAPQSTSGHAIFYITEKERKLLKILSAATNVDLRSMLTMLKSAQRLRAT